MVTLARRAQHIPFAPVVALLFGLVAAVLTAAVPQWMFEAAIVASGLPGVVSAAAPPLGLVARLLVIALAFGAGSLTVWVVLAAVTRLIKARARARTPWRDAGYDLAATPAADMPPPRRPIFAPDELGAPLMSDAAVAPLVEPEIELAAPLALDELAAPVAAPVDPDSSIAALIRRLEDGLARRAANDPDPDGSGMHATPLASAWIVPQAIEDWSPPPADTTTSARQAWG